MSSVEGQRRAAGAGRWWTGVACAFGILLAAPAGNAHAGLLDVTVHVRGQGAVTAEDGFRCASADPDPKRIGATCRHVVEVAGPLERVFRAEPAPGGNWALRGWRGCPSPGPEPGVCRLTVPTGGVAVRTLTVVFDDVRPPRVSVDGLTVGDAGATIAFSADEPAVFTCRIDGVRAPCESPASYALPEGAHTFGVTAADPAGRRGRSETVRFTVVDTALTGGPRPGAFERDHAAEIAFRSRAGRAYECRLDGRGLDGTGDWSPCTSPVRLADLAEGGHEFAARARNGPWVDPSPATVAWTVDSTPPDTVVAAGPAEGATTVSREVAFRVAAPDERGAMRFECRLDDEPFAPCDGGLAVFTLLSPGVHVFRARARDEAGNVDAAPVRRTWTSAYVDRDGDGHGSGADCNDGNPTIHPGAADVPDDGIDQDCDGAYPRSSDRDRDGVPAPLDCRDVRADIHPGAVDVPGDGVDQDCSGADARPPAARPPALLATRLRYVARPAGGRWRTARATRLVRLVLRGVPAGVTVTVGCRGRGCKGGTTRVVRRTVRRLRLTEAVRRSRLRPGATVTVTAVHRLRKGRRWRIRARQGLPPALSTACLAPGARFRAAC